MFKPVSLLGLTLIITLAAPAGIAQNGGVIHLPPLAAQGPGSMQPVPVKTGDEVLRQQAQAAAIQRLAEVKRDTEKLLQLVTELKAGVDKTDQTVMAADTVKKAEQVDKLAHSLKKKMNLLY